jgi:UDP-3-O-[3-hydroxymyristoyl] glucosamine N-acyltransferase
VLTLSVQPALGEKEIREIINAKGVKKMPTFQCGENVRMGQNVNIEEDVILGNNITIYDHVTIKKGALICDNVIIGYREFKAEEKSPLNF